MFLKKYEDRNKNNKVLFSIQYSGQWRSEGKRNRPRIKSELLFCYISNSLNLIPSSLSVHTYRPETTDSMAENQASKTAFCYDIEFFFYSCCVFASVPEHLHGQCWCWLLQSFQRGFSFLSGNKPGSFSLLQRRTSTFFSPNSSHLHQGSFNLLRPASLAGSPFFRYFNVCLLKLRG